MKKFLSEDILLIYKKLESLRSAESNLVKEICFVMEQGSESGGHDNAPLDAVNDTLARIRDRIKEVAALCVNYTVVEKSDMGIVSIGSIVHYEMGHTKEVKTLRGYNAGVYTTKEDNAIGYNSPLGSAILGKKKGETILLFNKKSVTIIDIY